MAKVNWPLMDELFRKTRGRVKYKLGAKSKLAAEPADIAQIDCSGFVRWIMARCVTAPTPPDGSQNQLAWAKRVRLKRIASYSDVRFAKKDPSRLFICFLSPGEGKLWPRHVWFVRAGKTMESCSSLGVGSRPWDTPILMGCVDCFEVTS